MKFLIIGCPRSGTMFIRSVFNEARYNMGSESRDGSDGRVTYLYGAGEGVEYKNYGPIIHQIRNPVDFVKSVALTTDLTMNYLVNSCKFSCNTYGLLDNIRTKDLRKLRTLCLIWYFWNESCEARSVFSYRVEDLSSVLNKLNEFLSINITQKHINLVSTRVNTRIGQDGYTYFNWFQIEEACGNFFPKFKKMTIRYDYEISI